MNSWLETMKWNIGHNFLAMIFFAQNAEEFFGLGIRNEISLCSFRCLLAFVIFVKDEVIKLLLKKYWENI